MYHLQLDIDECLEGLDMCSPNATCTNTDGEYTCSCDTGYLGDGFLCFSKFINVFIYIEIMFIHHRYR